MSQPHASQSQTPLWDDARLHDPHRQADKAVRVEQMFDAIAPSYERVNHIASMGQDAAWRRRTVALSGVSSTDVVLDLCCGTGDMIRTFAAHNPAPKLIIGVDFSSQMLVRGVYPASQTPIQLCRADALRLPLGDATVDIVTCAFGVRNFQNLDAGLLEMRRILRPAGRIAILEFALPDNALIRSGYRFYCERVLPRIATLVSRDRTGAYKYLPQSIRTFERRSAMITRVQSVGFADVKAVPLNLGGVVIYTARAN